MPCAAASSYGEVSTTAQVSAGTLITFYGATQITFALPDGSSNGGVVQFTSPASGTSTGSSGSGGGSSTNSQLLQQYDALESQINSLGAQLDALEAQDNAAGINPATDPQVLALSQQIAPLQQQAANLQNQMDS